MGGHVYDVGRGWPARPSGGRRGAACVGRPTLPVAAPLDRTGVGVGKNHAVPPLRPHARGDEPTLEGWYSHLVQAGACSASRPANKAQVSRSGGKPPWIQGTRLRHPADLPLHGTEIRVGPEQKAGLSHGFVRGKSRLARNIFECWEDPRRRPSSSAATSWHPAGAKLLPDRHRPRPLPARPRASRAGVADSPSSPWAP